MSLQTALIAVVTANTGLTALINGRLSTGSTATGLRFKPDRLDQDTLFPAIRFQEISRVERDWAFYGRPQLVTIRVQIDGYAATSVLRTTLRAAVMDCFLPNGARLSGSYGGETLIDIRTDGGDSGVEQLDTQTQAYTFRRDLICDFRFSTTL